MEPFVADFLLNKKIPKPVRYAVAGLITGLILFICIFAGVASPYIIGKVVCFITTTYVPRLLGGGQLSLSVVGINPPPKP